MRRPRLIHSPCEELNMETPSSFSDLQAMDAALRGMAHDRSQLAHRLCHELVAFDAAGGAQRLGFSSIREYGEHALGLTAREVRESLRVGRRLAALPKIDAALQAGEMSWSAARALTRVVVPETEAEWLREAQTGSMRELEAAISVSSVGEMPPDGASRPIAPAVTRFVFEVDSTDAQVVADALAMRRAELGSDVDVTDVFVDLCRTALASGAGAGAGAGAGGAAGACASDIPPERFQIVLQKCPTCEHVVHVGHGPAVHAVAPSTVAQAGCDAVVVEVAQGGRVSRTIPPSVRRRVAHRDGYCCAVPGCGARVWLDVHHLVPRAHGGTHDEGNLSLVCSAHHRRVHEGTLHLVRGADGALLARRGVASPEVCTLPRAPVAAEATHVGRSPVRVEVNVEASAPLTAAISAPLTAAIEGCAAEFGWVVPVFVKQRLGSPCAPDELAQAIETMAKARGWRSTEDGWYSCA